MENTGIEDTHPTMPDPEAGDENGLQHTKPIRIDSQSEKTDKSLASNLNSSLDDRFDASLEQTMPTPVIQEIKEEKLEASGFQDTMATPVASPVEAGLTMGSMAAPVKPASAAGKSKAKSAKSKPAAKKAIGSQPVKGKISQKKRLSWLIYTFVGLMVLLLIGLLSAFSGYSSGIGLRKHAESTQIASAADEQFLMGVQDMDQGSYDRARQRFEYVIQLNPNYPGATDKLSQVLMALNTTATPTQEAAPTASPTPDKRNVQELYNQSKQYVANSDWQNALDTVLALRKADPSYQTVDVDGIIFLALRELGKQKIVKADLEGGIYDLTLASHFGPLDTEAQAFLNWSTVYITGASFWGIDWAQAVSYFQQVAPQMPNLMDNSGMTANERLRQALFEYGNSLAQQKQFCQAVAQYNQSMAIAANSEVQQALNAAAKGCGGGGGSEPQPTAKPGKRQKPTATPGP